MVEFVLVIESKAPDGSLGEKVIEKKMSWPVLPRIGEELGIEGNGSRVTEVTHEFYKDTICVYVAVDFNEFEDLAVCDGYTQIFPVIST